MRRTAISEAATKPQTYTGNVAGVLGMLLAIPSYNVIRVFAKEFFNNFKLVQKLTENI